MENDEITTLDGLAAALDADEGQAQAPEADGTQAAEQDESTHEAEAPEGEEAATDDTGQAPAAPADDVVVKWTTSGGEAIEAPLAELKSGYLRQQDYTHKTQALAEERKQAETAVAQQFQQAQQLTRDHAKLMQLQEDLGAYQKADWNALYAQDPAEAGRLQAQWRQAEAQARELAGGIQSASQQLQQTQAQRVQQATQEAMQALQREIPGFGAETVKAARETGRVITVEDHSIVGGLGGAIAETLAEHQPTRMKRIGMTTYGRSGSPTGLYEHFGLDAHGIARGIREFMGKTQA